MKNSKKTISLILVMIMCLSLLSACGGSNGGDSGNNANTPTPTPTDRTKAEEAAVATPTQTDANVTYAEEIDIIIDNTSVASLNPFRGGGPAQMWSFNLMFDRLIYYMGNGEYIPSLAEDWNTEDFKTFTFKLREDVVFHNGENLKASDVVYTFNYGMNPENATVATWGLVESVKEIDEYTVEITLKNVDVDFYFRVSQPNIAIVNEKAMTDDPVNGMLIGTGAFALAEFVENNYWVFERNEDYWTDLAITKKITMRYIPEISSRTTMLQNGETQLCLKVNPDDMELFIDNPDYWIDDHIVNNPTVIFFNMTDSITGDYNFRMAVASAINKAEIALVAGGNYYLGDYESGSAWGYSTEFRNTDIPVIPEDIELAKEYLEKSVYNGEVIEICATNMVSTSRAAEVMQQQLSVVGINTEIKLMEGVAMNEYTHWDNNQAQLVVTPIAFSSSSSSFRSAMYPGAPSNRARYENPAVTELLDRAAGTFDYDERGQIYREIQEIIAQDVPYVNIWYLLQTVVAVKGLGGFNFPGDNLYDFRYIYWQLED